MTAFWRWAANTPISTRCKAGIIRRERSSEHEKQGKDASCRFRADARRQGTPPGVAQVFPLLTLYCLCSSIAPYVTVSPIVSPRASSATRSPYFMQAILSKGGPTMNWLQMRAASIAGSGPRRRSIIRKPQPGRRSRKTTNEPRADGTCGQRNFHGQLTMP